MLGHQCAATEVSDNPTDNHCHLKKQAYEAKHNSSIGDGSQGSGLQVVFSSFTQPIHYRRSGVTLSIIDTFHKDSIYPLAIEFS